MSNAIRRDNSLRTMLLGASNTSYPTRSPFIDQSGHVMLSCLHFLARTK